MDTGTNTVFILDNYSRYDDNTNVRQIFHLYEQWYCIREVELEWGRPKFARKIEDDFQNFYLFNTLEEAKQCVKRLKRAEGAKF